MLAELIQKREYWTTDKISEFNSTLLINPTEEQFAWEWTDTGFFYISDSLVEFTNIDTNQCFSINSKIDPNRWTLFRQVYINACEDKKVLIEAPMFRELTTVNGTAYEYIETRMHGSRIGKFQHLNSDEFISKLVEDVYQYMLILKSVSQDNNYPYVNFFDRIKTNIGFQWKRPMTQWNKSLDKVIGFCQEQLQAALEIFPDQKLTDDKKELIIAEATQKWSQLL